VALRKILLSKRGKKMSETRKARIKTGLSMKVNTGNYEVIEVSKEVEVDVEFSTTSELKEKSAGADKMVMALLKDELDAVCEKMGRARYFKINGKDCPVGLREEWGDKFDSIVASRPGSGE
jgi:hypothetical protein